MAEIKDCCSCIYETRSTFIEPCVSCGVDFLNYMAKPAPKRKRKTNADLIRAMTDEELAELWWERVDCGECPVHRDCRMTGQDCKKLALDWLREEAKE